MEVILGLWDGLVWCRCEMVGCGVGGRGRGMWWEIMREGGCEGGIAMCAHTWDKCPALVFVL